MRPLLFLVALAAVGLSAQPRELRWAGDPEGGAPFVEADPADPSRVVGFDVEIAELIARGTRPRAAVRFVAYRLDRSVGRARRLRHRPERHRGHARPPRRDGGDHSVLRVPRSAHRSRTPTPRASARSPISPAAASARSAARSPTRSCSRAGARYGITAVSYDDDVHPYSGSAARPRRRGAARQRHRRAAPMRHADRRSPCSRRRSPSATTSASSRRRTRALRDRDQRHSARRDARRRARGDLPQVERLERRSAGALRKRARRRARCRRSPVPESMTPMRPSRRAEPVGRDAALPARAAARRRRSRSSCRACRWRSPSSLGVLIASGRVYGNAPACGSR